MPLSRFSITRPSTPNSVDVAVAAALAAVSVPGHIVAQNLQGSPDALDPLAFILILAACAVITWRRVAPMWTLAAAVALVCCYLFLGYPYGPVQLCMVLAMFEAARLRPLLPSAVACVMVCVAVAGAMLFRLTTQVAQPGVVLIGWMSWLVLPWSIGTIVNVRAAALRRAERDSITRTMQNERVRIAREVHDVAGHGFAVIAMQAGVALRVFDQRPDQVRRALTAIRAASTQGLDELRAALDAWQQLGDSPDQPPIAAEEIGLDTLPGLVDSVRAGGLPVSLDINVADHSTTPREIAAATYRVVQESLTNVLRHAGPTTAEVHVSREAGHLVVRVGDRGRGVVEDVDGRGIAGMRTRVEAVGGTFAAGAREGGGFEVIARLPVTGD